MPDCLSLIWDHSVHFAKFPIEVLDILKIPLICMYMYLCLFRSMQWIYQKHIYIIHVYVIQ